MIEETFSLDASSFPANPNGKGLRENLFLNT